MKEVIESVINEGESSKRLNEFMTFVAKLQLPL